MFQALLHYLPIEDVIFSHDRIVVIGPGRGMCALSRYAAADRASSFSFCWSHKLTSVSRLTPRKWACPSNAASNSAPSNADSAHLL